MPHLHTHIVARYSDDPRPGWPFPFPEPDPGPIPDERLARDVALVRTKRAGLPAWVGTHTLRHTAASRFFRAGWSAKAVQVVLGHHSPAFTLATYVHLIDDDLPDPSFLDDLHVERKLNEPGEAQLARVQEIV